MTNRLEDCTFSRNDTVLELCCPSGNGSTPNVNTSRCITTSDDFWPCVADHGYMVSCRGEGTVSAAPKSAFFKAKLLVLATLLLMTNIVRADSTLTANYIGPAEPTSQVAKPLAAAAAGAVCEQDPSCDDPCAHYTSPGIIADFRVFSDENCQDQIDNPKIAIPCAPLALCASTMMCSGPLPDWWPNPVYVSPGGGFDLGAQLALTKKEYCPYGGAPATVGIIREQTYCLRVQAASPNWGMAYFRCGSGGLLGRGLVGQGNVTDRVEGPVRRRSTGYQGRLNRRQVANCQTFDADPRDAWRWNAYTPSRRVSHNIGCTQSTDSCPISVGQQWTETWTTTWQTTINVGADPFSVSTSVGGSYAYSVTSYHSTASSVPSGQTGFLSVYSEAVEVPGWFRDCGDGWDYRGSALVPSTHLTYEVILI